MTGATTSCFDKKDNKIWINGLTMILSYIVIWILWSFLQLALGSEIKQVILNPLNLLFIANFIIGIIQIQKKQAETFT